LINQLRAQALAVWDQIHPQRVKPATLDYLLQSRDYILVFWFENGSNTKQPALISKIPRFKKFNCYLERSVKLVDGLKRDLKTPIVETLPTSVIAGRVNDLTHVVMGTVSGEPINIPADNFLGRQAAGQHLSAFLTWLIEFQAQSRISYQDYDCVEFINEQYSKAEFEFLRADQYRPYTQQISARLSSLTLPLTWGYGDAHHSNILMERDRISGVIDWIGVEEQQWFHCDWYYFLFFYALEFFKKNRKNSPDFQRKLAISTTMGVGDHWLTDLFQEKTRYFLENYSIDPNLSPELFITFLYNLHWPQGKARLIQDSFAIYNQVTRQFSNTTISSSLSGP
jgi:hypothetical protein